MHELDALRSEIRGSLESCASEFRQHGWEHTTATSGTALAIGAALNNTAPGVASAVGLAELRTLNAKLAALSLAERKNVAGLTPQRADIIVAGGLVLEGTMSALGIESLRICDWSLREGVIIDRLREWERVSMARPAGEKIDRMS
jgi:exopolyphosphatase/guanosine-5'-triphosphate,3'-diphosphate pyrophosphatase